jgi:general L-amino acid transport system permease protein
MPPSPVQGPPERRWSWRSRRLRGALYQLLAIAAVAAVVALLLHNTLANLRARGIQSGFGFLVDPAGFDIGESLLRYESLDSYLRAFAVGGLNTLRVALAGIVLATLLGALLGIGRFARNALVRGACQAYVELFRNIPLLLQLLTWYLLATEWLPPADAALRLGDWGLISKSGLSLPWPIWSAEGGWLSGPTGWSRPVVDGLSVQGGASLTPEFLALLVGLTLYTAAFIAEVVRAGIAAVPAGQVEAAASLGLPRGVTLRRVILPQALRVIVPPLTSQYLNLTKNSSLAVAIGYPDVVSIANTALNQTGRAVECIAVIMAVYLGLSLLTAAAMNAYNRRVAIRER